MELTKAEIQEAIAKRLGFTSWNFFSDSTSTHIHLPSLAKTIMELEERISALECLISKAE